MRGSGDPTMAIVSAPGVPAASRTRRSRVLGSLPWVTPVTLVWASSARGEPSRSAASARRPRTARLPERWSLGHLLGSCFGVGRAPCRTCVMFARKSVLSVPRRPPNISDLAKSHGSGAAFLPRAFTATPATYFGATLPPPRPPTVEPAPSEPSSGRPVEFPRISFARQGTYLVKLLSGSGAVRALRGRRGSPARLPPWQRRRSVGFVGGAWAMLGSRIWTSKTAMRRSGGRRHRPA